VTTAGAPAEPAESSGRVRGKVALITGAARGQGRSHAVRLAREGADIIGIDICDDLPGIPYPLATPADLEETARLVAGTGRTMVSHRVDVRDSGALSAAVDDGVGHLGRLDVAVANAGVCTVQRWDEVTPSVWDTVVGVNLTGVWNTCVAATPHLIAAGGGSMVLISSVAGLKGQPFFHPYTASKHALVGVMRSLAVELAMYDIRVNSIHPTGVDTPMLAGLSGLGECIDSNPRTGSVFLNSLPVDLVTPADVSEALVFLSSDESRMVTGLTLTVDAGSATR
jgi:SDR family mycofactocin-dependent oxidoreductase